MGHYYLDSKKWMPTGDQLKFSTRMAPSPRSATVESARAALEAEREKELKRRRALLLSAQSSADEVAIVGFQGGDDWIRAQRERHLVKLGQRAAINASDVPLVDFDRNKFSREVKRVLADDDTTGFVIKLKRRREFAAKLCHDYKFFTEKQKLELVLALAVDLGIQDLSQMVKTLPSLPRTHLVLNVMAAALGFDRKNDPTIAKNIKKGLVPVPEQFFLLVGSVPLGPKFLLRLRVDLSQVLKKFGPGLPSENREALEYLDLVMRDLFATQAGTRFRRIDMASEKLVAFMLKNERVHAVCNWMDLKRRISGPNRFCFGLFHLQMPFSPVVFVEVVVTDHLCDKIDPILNSDGPRVDHPSHIIFYSISNANSGLRELNTASHLLFLTIERMSSLYPQCHTSATLSPVPGFANWFKSELEHVNRRRAYFTTEQTQRLAIQFGVNQAQLTKWLLKKLNTADWYQDSEFTAAIQDVLVSACAQYVLFERQGDKMLNPVANFHLQNGAQVEQINFLADPSPEGIKSALGFMVNYRYCMTSIAHTSDSYKRTSAAAAALRVTRLVWPSPCVILDEIEKLLHTRNTPLFARPYRKGETLCRRGTLTTDVFFVCSGSIRVYSAHPVKLSDGEMYGYHEVMNKEPVPFTVQVIEDSRIMLLPSEDLKEIMKDSSVLRDFALTESRKQYHSGHRRLQTDAMTTSRL